jgi:hypothetical protein
MSTIVKALLQGRDETNPLELLDREDLIKLVKTMLGNGVALTFHGKRSALEISRRVRFVHRASVAMGARGRQHPFVYYPFPS